MSDVGDALELTFNTAPGAAVTVSWFDPDHVPVFEDVPVSESATTPGAFTQTFQGTKPGLWEARFVASGAATAFEQFFENFEAVTGPPPLAGVGQVEQEMPLAPAQQALAKVLLRKASIILRNSYPNMAERIAAGSLAPEMPGFVAVNMVLRVLRNPNGLKAETVGPFSRTYDTTVAVGLVELTERDMQQMAPPRTAARAGTIMVRAGLAPPRRCGIWHGR